MFRLRELTRNFCLTPVRWDDCIRSSLRQSHKVKVPPHRSRANPLLSTTKEELELLERRRMGDDRDITPSLGESRQSEVARDC